jgi:prepilin-type N-terminal cleavage/methylation domain-containing protein
LRRRNAGFTLIEMMVAAIVLAVGIAGALGAISAATRAEGMAEQMHTAVLLARQQLTNTEQNLASLAGGTTNGDFGNDYPGYSWSQDVEATDSQYNFQVTMTVSYGSQPHQQQYVVTTYLNTQMAIYQQQNPTTTTGTTGGTGG